METRSVGPMTTSKRSVLVLLPVVLLVGACTGVAGSRPEVAYAPVRTTASGGQASNSQISNPRGGWAGEAEGYGTVASSTGDAAPPAASEVPASAPSAPST